MCQCSKVGVSVCVQRLMCLCLCAGGGCASRPESSRAGRCWHGKLQRHGSVTAATAAWQLCQLGHPLQVKVVSCQ